ncbi:unnamed protein product [Paramecium sonneborni]|uniref:Uncharacterized protein n=1 Tax=Paramecium sonneborni TaxID=65129 RepID=A0A8S1MFS3_9CILI|nr:unnamed protein product [Paramecium sonneborni]
MGNVDSVEEAFLPELKKMNLILDKGFYKVYESSENNKYDFWFLKSSDNSFEEELKIAADIQKENLPGLAKIENIQQKQFDKLFQKYYCLNILTEHPSYNLREYLQKKTKDNCLTPQQITDLTISITNAQFKLGSKKQFLGYENIYTSDGVIWKIKPFVETKSFYQELQEYQSKNSKQFEMSGFPSPEEFQQGHCDPDRVQIFSFGMLILELITKQKSRDIYLKFKINENLLAERINVLRQQSIYYKGKMIDSVIEMLDLDLVRRPNYQQLYAKLNKNSRIISLVINPEIKPIKNEINLFSEIKQKESEVHIKDAVSKIEQSFNSKLHDHKLKLSKSIWNSKLIDENLTYYGVLENKKYQGQGKLFTKKNELLYEGFFNQGQYHEFGTLNYFNTMVLENSFPYQDLTNIEKYAKWYEGSFQNGKKHGEGRLTLTNQEYFIGSFVYDVIDGYGSFITKDSKKIIGIWKNGKFVSNPENVQSFQNQEINKPYEGLSKINTERSQQLQSQSLDHIETATRNVLSDINQESEQRLYYDDQKTKIKYQGEILQGKKNGEGKLYFENGKLQFEGKFLQDQFHAGTLYNEHPVIHHQINYSLLREVQEKGYWKYYVGQFLDGKKNGQGQWYLTDNSEFFGLFENDLPHGEGMLKRINCDELSANWEQGVLLKLIKGKL